MVGNLVCGYKIIDSIKTIEMDEKLKELSYELAHIQGRFNGVADTLEYIDENIEMNNEIFNKLYDDSVEKLIKRVRGVIVEIQNILRIENQFFICDVSKNAINIFDVGYEDDFFSDKNTILIAEDLKRIIIDNKEED